MRRFLIERGLERKLIKLERKNKALYEQVKNKINEVLNILDMGHYKNLRHDLKEYKRVHIDKSFVLLFKVYKDKNVIYFDKLKHHNEVYK